MINNYDIKLGDYYFDRGGKIIRVDFIEHNEENYDVKFGQYNDIPNLHPLTEYSKYANPIPISKQWLTNFKFEEAVSDFEGCFQTDNGKYLIQMCSSGCMVFINISNSEKYELLTGFEYIHEFQQFIYRVTNKKLKL